MIRIIIYTVCCLFKKNYGLERGSSNSPEMLTERFHITLERDKYIFEFTFVQTPGSSK